MVSALVMLTIYSIKNIYESPAVFKKVSVFYEDLHIFKEKRQVHFYFLMFIFRRGLVAYIPVVVPFSPEF